MEQFLPGTTHIVRVRSGLRNKMIKHLAYDIAKQLPKNNVKFTLKAIKKLKLVIRNDFYSSAVNNKMQIFIRGYSSAKNH